MIEKVHKNYFIMPITLENYMNVLVLGAGGAGISAVKAIRKANKNIDINIVSNENCLPYSLCSLPDLISDQISIAVLNRLDPVFFTKNNINFIIGKEAIKLDSSKKIVYLQNKFKNKSVKTLEFDKLLIAIGSKPIIPNIFGLNKKEVYIVSDLESCKSIIKGLKKAKKIAVIGGGFVGIEVAQAINLRKKEVYVIESLDQILANIFDKEIADIAKERLEKIGINFILNTTAKKIIGNNKVEGLELEDRTIDCDMVLLTVGVKPNIDFVKESKIKTNQGIIVNEFMETNIKDIFAAGDVAESFDCIYGKPGFKATWSNAVEQGHVAGLNIVGKKCKYPGFQSYNIVHINDIPFLSMGNVTNLPKNSTELVSKSSDSVRKVFIQNNKILGIEFYNDMTNSGHLFSLINKESDITGYNKKLLSNYFQYLENGN
jgi:NAD(P)H-nitrite reductase large subunit